MAGDLVERVARIISPGAFCEPTNYTVNCTPEVQAFRREHALIRAQTIVATIEQETREKCAKIADSASKAWEDCIHMHRHLNMKHRREGMSHGAKILAQSIRASASTSPDGKGE